MHVGQLELYSYAAMLLGQRHLLLSLLGCVLILLLTRLWRRHASASILTAWLFFLSWLVWGPLVFTPERLQGLQAPVRYQLSQIIPADVFSFCSQSVSHRFLPPPLEFLPDVGWNLLVIVLWTVLASWRAAALWRNRQHFRQIARTADSLNDAASRALIQRWRQAFQLKRQVELRTSEACDQAFTIGVWRPIIFLPRTFLRELQTAELDAVIGHEMAHVHRYDDLVIHLQRVFKALFFFNPILNLTNRRVAELREHCCDRLAMERGKLSVRHYGSSLLRTLALAPSRFRDAESAEVAGLGASSLRRRIESLTQVKRGFSWLPLTVSALSLAALSLLFGHTGSDPMGTHQSNRILSDLGAVSPVPGGQIAAKPFVWPDRCVIGHIDQHLYHPGVDFATPAQKTTPVQTIAAGRVTHAFQRNGNWRVHIEHANGVVSTYLHLDNVSVRPGDQLQAGAAIARNDGSRHTYVHVEVHQRGRVLDPSLLLTSH